MTEPSGDRGSPAASPEIDRLLTEMGARARRTAPRPTERLVERVLGDAATVAAARAATTGPFTVPAGAAEPAPLPAAPGWAARLAGWLAEPRLAAAVLALSLFAGIGTGYALGPSPRTADLTAYASDPGWDEVDEAFVVAGLF